MSEEDLKKLISGFIQKLDDAQKDSLLRTILVRTGSLDSESEPLLQRLRPILEAVDQLGKPDPDFDLKAYLDENYEEM